MVVLLGDADMAGIGPKRKDAGSGGWTWMCNFGVLSHVVGNSMLGFLLVCFGNRLQLVGLKMKMVTLYKGELRESP